MAVAGEVMRAVFPSSRESFEKPLLQPVNVENVRFAVSMWPSHLRKATGADDRAKRRVPLVDRNPQKLWTLSAERHRFYKETSRVYHDSEHPSKIILPV